MFQAGRTLIDARAFVRDGTRLVVLRRDGGCGGVGAMQFCAQRCWWTPEVFGIAGAHRKEVAYYVPDGYMIAEIHRAAHYGTRSNYSLYVTRVIRSIEYICSITI